MPQTSVLPRALHAAADGDGEEDADEGHAGRDLGHRRAQREQEGRAVVRLTPAPGNTSSAGNIVLTVDTAAMRPVSLRYDYDGEQVQVSVLGIKPLETPLKAFAKDNYAGYEFIDFR